MGYRDEKKQAKRNQIVENAIKLFAAKGFEQVTTEEIAQASDIAKKTLFQYFPTKDSIVFGHERELLDLILGFLAKRPRNLWAEYRKLLEDIAKEDQKIDLAVEMFAVPRIITESPVLSNRLMVMWATYEQEIGQALMDREIVMDSMEAQIMAVHMVLVFRMTFAHNVNPNEVFSKMQDCFQRLIVGTEG